MIGAEVILLRMVWHPAHFENGQLVGSAFESGDLRPDNDRDGHPRYISCDRQDDLRKESVDSRIDGQMRDGAENRDKRHEARFVEFVTEALRATTDETGIHPFEVTSEPIVPENPGHCGIRNVSGKGKSRKAEDRAYIEELRTILLGQNRGISGYRDYFPAAIPD